MPALTLKVILRKVIHKLTCACAGTELGGDAALHQDLQGRHRPVKEEKILRGRQSGDPTEDTGKVAGVTVTGRTRRNRTTGAAQDAVAEEAVTLVGVRT